MRTRFFFTLWLCSLLCCVVSCNSDENEQDFITLSPPTDEIIFEALGGTRIIEVETNRNTWSVESDQSWCKVEQTDNTHFTVTAEENTTTESLSMATVTVVAGTESVSFKVYQKAGKKEFVITIDVTDLSAHYAMLKLTPSDDNVLYTAVCVLADDISGIEGDDALMEHIIKYFQPPILLREYSEPLMPLTAKTNYCVLAFGINEEEQKPTSKLFRYDFTTPEAIAGGISVEKIDYKFFDAEEIKQREPSYEENLEGCEVVGVVTMTPSRPTDKILMWWYEVWLKDLGDEMDDAILEDLLLPNVYNKNPEFMPMYYSMSEEDKFFFAGAVADEDGNFSDIYYTEEFYLDKSKCSDVDEFFSLLNSGRTISTFALRKKDTTAPIVGRKQIETHISRVGKFGNGIRSYKWKKSMKQ